MYVHQVVMQSVGKTIHASFQRITRGLLKRIYRDDERKRKMVNNHFGQYEIVEPWEVSDQKRTVPAHILRPYYAELEPHVQLASQDRIAKEIEIKDENGILGMRASCRLAKWVLNSAKDHIKVGRTTDELDRIIHDMIISKGAYPSPLNYHGFPKSICTSINNVACHGIPDTRPLRRGDIMNVDVTVYFNGYHGDCSAMFKVGNECDLEGQRLINVTELCLTKAIEICKPNEKICNIGNIIEETADKNGYNVVPAFIGHGIGVDFHGPPDIYHNANENDDEMKAGMTFTIEPVLSQGSNEVEILEDGWTAVTVDDSRTAQVEHTILITDTGCEVLTK